MLSYAYRYQPVVLELKKFPPNFVLEVGSGAEGLRMFWHGKVFGTDLWFKRRPLPHGVVATSLALPFAEHSCPVVVSCDMLEHLQEGQRQSAVMEMSRVAQTRLWLAFPGGEVAKRMYGKLAQENATKVPLWLQEHLDYGLPDAEQVADWLKQEGWTVSVLWYESARAHMRLARWEMHWAFRLLVYGLMRLMGPWLVTKISVSSGGEPLRVLIRAERNSP